jgi:hypothetical protein
MSGELFTARIPGADGPPSGVAATKRVRQSFLVYAGENARVLTLVGRFAWMMGQLVHAGSTGVTSLQNPAPRMSHYVWVLRHRYGIQIESIEEEHSGAYPGRHVRYHLLQRVEFAVNNGDLK